MKALLAAVAAPETLEDLEGAAAVETTARTLTSLNRIPGEPKALSLWRLACQSLSVGFTTS